MSYLYRIYFVLCIFFSLSQFKDDIYKNKLLLYLIVYWYLLCDKFAENLASYDITHLLSHSF